MRLFLRPSSGQFKRHAAVVASFVYLFVFVCGGAHTRQHCPATQPPCAHLDLWKLQQIVWRRAALAVSIPLPSWVASACAPHMAWFCVVTATLTLTLKCFGPSPSHLPPPVYLKFFLPPKQTQILRKQIETETGTQTRIWSALPQLLLAKNLTTRRCVYGSLRVCVNICTHCVPYVAPPSDPPALSTFE